MSHFTTIIRLNLLTYEGQKTAVAIKIDRQTNAMQCVREPFMQWLNKIIIQTGRKAKYTAYLERGWKNTERILQRTNELVQLGKLQLHLFDVRFTGRTQQLLEVEYLSTQKRVTQ